MLTALLLSHCFLLAVAVGWLSQDSASVLASGVKGKAVSIVHCYGDELWKLGPQTPPNVGFVRDRVYAIRIASADGSEEGAAEEEEASEEKAAEWMDNLHIDAAPPASAVEASPADAFYDANELAPAAAAIPPDSSSSSSSIAAPTTSADAAEASEQPSSDVPDIAAVAAEADEAPPSASPEASPDAESESDEEAGDASDADDGTRKLSASEMDDALLRCFLLAAAARIKDSDLPMDPSTLLSHMEACNVEPNAERLDVRRSSYKKMSKFIKQLGKLNLAKSKTGGGKQGMCSTELQVMSISRSSPLMAGLVTAAFLDAMKRKQKESNKAHAKGATTAAASSSSVSGSGTGPVQILFRYKPDQKLQRLLFDEQQAKQLWEMKGQQRKRSREACLGNLSASCLSLDPLALFFVASVVQMRSSSCGIM